LGNSGLISGAFSSGDGGFNLSQKGQIHTYSTTQAALNVGDNDQILTADSGETTGIKWATAAGGATVSKVQVSLAATFTTSSTTYVDVTSWTLTKPDITDGICFSLATGTTYGGTGQNQSFQLMDNGVSVSQSVVRQNTIDVGVPHAIVTVTDLSASDGNPLHVEMKVGSGSGSIYYSTSFGIGKLVCMGVG